VRNSERALADSFRQVKRLLPGSLRLLSIKEGAKLGVTWGLLRVLGVVAFDSLSIEATVLIGGRTKTFDRARSRVYRGAEPEALGTGLGRVNRLT
jgi:hypothetical protein